MNNYFTIGRLAKHFGETHAVLNHALRTYGPEPVGQVAITRVWSRDQLADIEQSLKTSAANRTRPTQKDRTVNV